MNKIAPILTVVCLGMLLAFNWGLLPLFPPLQQAIITPPPVVPPPPVLADPPPSASPPEAHNLFLTELELEVYELINENRVSLGLKPLSRRPATLLAALAPEPHCGVPALPGPLIPAAVVISAASPTAAGAKIKRKVRSRLHPPPEKDPRQRPGRRRTASGWAQNLE